MIKRSTYNPSLPFIKENLTGNLLNEKQQYINLDGASEKSFAELLKWQTQNNPLKYLKQKQSTIVDVVANSAITKNKSEGIVWLGHASFLFTLCGKHFIADPVLYQVGPVKRYTSLPCAVNNLTNIDYILISHNHRDHCDKKSLQHICTLNPHAIILTGLNMSPLLKSWKINNYITEAGWYQQYQLETDVHITYLPAKHWNRRGLTDINTMLWGSFMLEGNNQTIYFGADSGLGVHFAEIAQLFPNINYALLGIGAYMPEWFMHTAHTSPADALLAFNQLKATHFIPMHHGTFDMSDEPVFYPKQELLQLQEQQNIYNIEHLTIGKKLEI